MLLHAEGSASPRCIQDGDMVVVYERFDSMKAVTVTLRGIYNNKFGNFAMKDWIGKPFGSKMRAKPPNSGWVYVLAPTPELWTQVLRHRTQILYVADISMVCTLLELRPGCTVLESGTGSGSLTTSLARAVAPTGHVHTFEFHEQRARAAVEEFQANGLGDLVSVKQRDIEGQGFPEVLHGKADALFLDLPGPWKVVPSASLCLRPDGVFCSFSPCIEQVQRTCEALNANGFREMRTMEVLLRHYEVTSEHLVTELDGEAQLDPRRRQQQQPKPQRQGQGRGGDTPGQQGNKRRKTDDSQQQAPAGQQNGVASPHDADAASSGAEQAPQAAGGDEHEEAAGAKDAATEAVDGSGEGLREAELGRGPEGNGGEPTQAPAGKKERRVLARPVVQGRGHTGYLTFARKAVS